MNYIVLDTFFHSSVSSYWLIQEDVGIQAEYSSIPSSTHYGLHPNMMVNLHVYTVLSSIINLISQSNDTHDLVVLKCIFLDYKKFHSGS